MNVFHTVFGLLLRSNLSIPGLTPERASAKSPDVEVHFGVLPGAICESQNAVEELIYASSYLAESGEPALKTWKIASGAFLRLDYFDGTQFWLDPEGTAVWAVWPATQSLEDVVHVMVLSFLQIPS